MSSLQNQKRRIRSISNTLDVASAMELVSFAKLKKLKDQYEYSKEYYRLKKEVLDKALSNQSMDLKETQTDRYLIIITSSLGLCGSYNDEVIKKLENINLEGYKLIVLGEKGISYCKKYNLKMCLQYRDYNEFISDDLYKYLVEELEKGLVKSIEIIYTNYQNNFIHPVRKEVIYPISSNDVNYTQQYLIETSVESLIRISLKDSLDKALLESILSENASRNIAMHQASDNASDLKDELILVYNKMRQQQITNEIRDIVGGGD